MKPTSIALLACILLAGTALAQQPPVNLVLTSTGFMDGGKIKTPFACENSQNFSHHSPALAWSGAPAGTAAFTLLVHDTDAHPRKGANDVTHWLIWNIPGTAAKLAENVPADPQLADGARQAKNVTNTVGYMGPCAPVGKPHHYIWELYALDKALDVMPDGTRDDVVKAMEGHVLASSVLVGQFNQ